MNRDFDPYLKYRWTRRRIAPQTRRSQVPTHADSPSSTDPMPLDLPAVASVGLYEASTATRLGFTEDGDQCVGLPVQPKDVFDSRG